MAREYTWKPFSVRVQREVKSPQIMAKRVNPMSLTT